MKYKIFCSDYDGTLVRKDGTVSQYTKDTIARYVKAGGKFVLCTGRMLSSARSRVADLGIKEGLVVSFQGAVIADIATGEILKSEAFTPEEALKVLYLLEKENHHIHIYTQDDLLANRRDEMLNAYEKMCKVTAKVPGGLLSDYLKRDPFPVPKILIMVEPHRRDALYRMLCDNLDDRFIVTCSNVWLVELMPKGQDKASAVRFLSEYFSVPREEIAAIGDQLNDLTMVEAAGGKFTVENAVDDLKRIARVMPSCEDDGVACALEIAMGQGE